VVGGFGAAGAPTPDLRFVQTGPAAVQISTPTQSLEVAFVAFRQEQAWMGLG
jgi:hypothetical protein